MPTLGNILWCALIGVVCVVESVAANSQGSLAILVPTREGLAACADRREWNRVRGASDSVKKISPVGSRLAFVVTGTVAVLNATTLQPEFSVYEEVRRHLFSDSGLPVDQLIERLPMVLERAYQQHRNGGGSELTLSPGATDDVIFSVLLWYTNGDGVRVNQLQFHNRAVSGPSHMSGRDMSMELAQKFYIEGETDFVLAAIRRSDPRFRFFKGDPDIRTVWTATNADTISVDLALRFARKIIRATNKYHSLVSSGTPSLVSAESDCSLMSPARGFVWK